LSIAKLSTGGNLFLKESTGKMLITLFQNVETVQKRLGYGRGTMRFTEFFKVLTWGTLAYTGIGATLIKI
jgi:hypothetical protein